MKSSIKTLTLCLFLFTQFIAQGQSFNGVWENEKNTGIVSLVITGESKVRAVERCSTGKCDLGVTNFGRVRTINSGTYYSAVFSSTNVTRRLKFKKLSNNRIQVKGTYTYPNNGPSRNFTHYYKKSTRVRTIPTNSNPSTVSETYYQVKIHYLKCIDTDDITGADEVRVIYLKDDEPAFKMDKNLNDGEKLYVAGTHDFKDVFTIKVYDDEVAADDYIGQFRIYRPRSGKHYKTISSSSAKYALSYTVTPKRKTVSTRPRNVRIELIDVTCDETEDITGNDDFYVLGGLVMGDRSGSILTQPISINNNQNKAFRVGQRTIYNGPIPSNADRLSIGLVAMEEDAGAVWKRNQTQWLQLSRRIGRSIDDLASKEGVVDSDLAETVAETATEIFGELLRADEDDELHRLALDFDISDLRIDDKTVHWSFSGDGARYTVRFRITGLR